MADIVLNPTFDANEVEAAKPAIHKNAASMDPETNAIESIHYTSFRDHAMGQPVSGIKDNVYNITAEQVKEFHAANYVGENIVVSGAGDVNAAQFNEVVNRHFGNAKATREGNVENSEQPFFTPSAMFVRDDELPNATICTGFIAPSVNDPDSVAMGFFKRLLGQYRIDKYTGAHLNTARLQYNSFHTELANWPDIILHKPFYHAYSDTGLFFNYFFGNEVWNRQMTLMGQYQLSCFAQNVMHALILDPTS